ncbi:uncharacterized protein METZ01_LOCUS21533, partial [marine metagenome]
VTVSVPVVPEKFSSTDIITAQAMIEDWANQDRFDLAAWN